MDIVGLSSFSQGELLIGPPPKSSAAASGSAAANCQFIMAMDMAEYR